MRINTINSDFVMINLEEIVDIVFYSQNIPEKYKNISSEILQSLYEYKKNTLGDINIFAMKKEDNSIAQILEKEISLQEYQNALMYAIVNNCDLDVISILEDLIKSRKTLKISLIRKKYGKDISDFIIEKSDYDYVTDSNKNKEIDSNFILYNDGEIIRINLKQKNNVLMLNNKRVK